MPNSTVGVDDPADDDTLIRPKDAADLLGVSVQTLARWERIGRISARRTLGGQRRFRRADIIALTGEPTPA